MVDVAFKLLIDNIEFVDKLFKLLNIVVDVVFKLLIDNIDDVEKLLKLVKSGKLKNNFTDFNKYSTTKEGRYKTMCDHYYVCY